MLGINTNVASILAQNAVGNTTMDMQKSIQRLSTGLRINSAQDDPAGLAIATRMTAQINGLNQAVLNANFGVSLTQTAGGALSSATNALQTVRQLAVESANASNTGVDRSSLDSQVQQLIQQIQGIATQTQFNGQNILDGSFGTAQFQVGANANQTITATLGNIQTSVLGGYSYTNNATSAALATGDLTINGVQIAATANGQASTIAQAINAVSGQTNVSATAVTTSAAGATVTASSAAVGSDLTINGVQIGGIAGSASVSVQAQQAANAINQVTQQTGVIASVNGSNQLVLSNTTGADIVVTATAAGTAATGLSAGTTHGKVTLNSSSTFTVGGNTPASAGFAAGSQGTLSALSGVSIATTAGANSAISVVDGALAQINSLQATIGAVETRFQTVVSSLQTSSTNLTSARSSLQDTDFAAETANLSKAQILEQAGTAMVAQANSIPSQVLTLLKSA